MNTSENIDQIATALAAAQVEFTPVPKDKTAEVQTKGGGKYKYHYADIADVLAAALPILGKHGLATLQATHIEGRSIMLRTRIVHTSGQWVESEYPVCSIPDGADHQRMGAALTYARRYAISSLIGLASDEDTDAQDAPPANVPDQTSNRSVQSRPASTPKPGDKGAVAALMHAIGLCETEADLNGWYTDNGSAAIGGLSDQDRSDVRAAWAARREVIRQGQHDPEHLETAE